MDPQMIAALVAAERRTEHDARYQRRRDALSERDRHFAAQARVDWWRRIRARAAHSIRRLAEAIEPPRPACVSCVADAH